MANTRYQYVRAFQEQATILHHNYPVIRVDGRGFSTFVKDHSYAKPNDMGGLALMNTAALAVMNDHVFGSELVMAFGHSDEFSFVLKRTTKLYGRKGTKIASMIASLFTSSFVLAWPSHMKVPLQTPPVFDGRVIPFPTNRILKDYLRWRQADCHINNLYNTAFWALVNEGGRTCTEACEDLKGTVSSDKNEILYTRFNINYNNEPLQARKGSVYLRQRIDKGVNVNDKGSIGDTHDGGPSDCGENQPKKKRKVLSKFEIVLCHDDIIGEPFWEEHGDALLERD